jgi:ferredoxin
MAHITFHSSRHGKPIAVEVPAGHQSTLLAIALDAGIPILFNCESGGCGACLVRVKTSDTGSAGTLVSLSEDEEFLLDAMGKLAPEDTGITDEAGCVERFRLACQYIVGETDELIVSYEDRLGGG